jgi:hypothetical protein
MVSVAQLPAAEYYCRTVLAQFLRNLEHVAEQSTCSCLRGLNTAALPLVLDLS